MAPTLSGGRDARRLLLLLLPLLAVAVLWVHWPVLSANALSYDDTYYLTENYLVQNPSWVSVRRFLTEVLSPSSVRGYYQPLAMISLMLDSALGGTPEHLWPFHATSLALHVASTLLLAVLIYELFQRVGPAVLTALLFGVHPVTVEPIAWISDRKTVLAAFFAILCLVYYVRYVRTGRRGFYLASVLLFIPALLSKPTTTMLPAALLLMDMWPLRRLSGDSSSPGSGSYGRDLVRRNRWGVVWEKIPFFALSLASGVITVISQARTAALSLPGEKASAMQIPLRLTHNIVFYLWKLFWPTSLSSYYPVPDPFSLAQPMVLIGLIGSVALLICLVLSLRWTPALLIGWLIFFLMQLPTMQILGFSHVIAADKFEYLPSFGMLLVVGGGLAWLWTADGKGNRWRMPVIVCGLVLVVAGLEARMTRSYLAVWRDGETLYRHMVAGAPNVAEVRHGLGLALANKGKLDEAIQEITRVIQLDPADGKAELNLGLTLVNAGRPDEGLVHLNRGVSLRPTDADGLNLLATALLRQGRGAEAEKYLVDAIRYKPDHLAARLNYGRWLLESGRSAEAVEAYRAALRIHPQSTYAWMGLGDALRLQGQAEEATRAYAQAARLSQKN